MIFAQRFDDDGNGLVAAGDVTLQVMLVEPGRVAIQAREAIFLLHFLVGHAAPQRLGHEAPGTDAPDAPGDGVGAGTAAGAVFFVERARLAQTVGRVHPARVRWSLTDMPADYYQRKFNSMIANSCIIIIFNNNKIINDE